MRTIQREQPTIDRDKNLRSLAKGTLVLKTDDGEPGRIIEVCTFRRNGIDAFSYAVPRGLGGRRTVRARAAGGTRRCPGIAAEMT